jgi:hypothetical protein
MGGAEIKSYAAAAQALVLIFIRSTAGSPRESIGRS